MVQLAILFHNIIRILIHYYSAGQCMENIWRYMNLIAKNPKIEGLDERTTKLKLETQTQISIIHLF